MKTCCHSARWKGNSGWLSLTDTQKQRDGVHPFVSSLVTMLSTAVQRPPIPLKIPTVPRIPGRAIFSDFSIAGPSILKFRLTILDDPVFLDAHPLMSSTGKASRRIPLRQTMRSTILNMNAPDNNLLWTQPDFAEINLSGVCKTYRETVQVFNTIHPHFTVRRCGFDISNVD
jgi:hypothetical protein